MYDFEYNNIMDFWSKEYHIHIDTEDRTKLIKLYEMELDNRPELDFSNLCQHLVLQVYCMTKYPKLNLFEAAFAPWALN
jgi:hypothetical protein